MSPTGKVGNIPLETVIWSIDFGINLVGIGSIPSRMNRVWNASIPLRRHFEGESACRLCYRNMRLHMSVVYKFKLQLSLMGSVTVSVTRADHGYLLFLRWVELFSTSPWMCWLYCLCLYWSLRHLDDL